MTAFGEGRQIQIIRLMEGELMLNENSLQDILTQQHVRDLPVVVVSIAGKARHGKSLLLSTFVRYLQLQGCAGWLSDAFGPLQGFVWKGGATGVTTGVYIWSEPFIVALDSGEQVAVILMDTQGSFDAQSNVKESAVVFALSTMISSMQIYNIKGQLAGDDLLHLQMFTEYGKLAQQFDNQGTNPFQSLQILVRDWVHMVEAEFGFDGGKKHLKKVFDVECQKNQENKDLVRGIKSSFRSIECFLMPEPKSCVRGGVFDGTPSAMGTAFTEQLEMFVHHILSPGKLVVKQLGGREVKTGQLLHQFQSLAKVFNCKEMLTPKPMMQANAEASYRIAIDETVMVYKQLADAEFRGHTASFTDAQLKNLFLNCRRAAVAEFTKTPKMGGEDMAKKFRQQVEEKIGLLESSFIDQNARRIEEEKSKQETKEQHLKELHEREERHKKETKAALKIVEEEARQMKLATEESHKLYIQQMEVRHQLMTLEDRQHSQDEMRKVHREYEKQIQRYIRDAEERARDITAKSEERQRQMRKEFEEKMASVSQPGTDPLQFVADLAGNVLGGVLGARGGLGGRLIGSAALPMLGAMQNAPRR